MENVVVILVFAILGLIIGITVRIKFNSQVTQLRIEHEALKKNLKWDAV